MTTTLTQAKDQLKIALSRLENIINDKIKTIETENSLLRTEIVKLKSKPARAKKTANDNPELELSSTSSPNDEFDDTLNELRRLVGQR